MNLQEYNKIVADTDHEWTPEQLRDLIYSPSEVRRSFLDSYGLRGIFAVKCVNNGWGCADLDWETSLFECPCCPYSTNCAVDCHEIYADLIAKEGSYPK